MNLYHSCGHLWTLDKDRHTTRHVPRPEKIAAVLCDTCRAAYNNVNEAARIESERRGLPPLRGKSPRIVEWATSIRIEVLVAMEERLAGQERISFEDGRRLLEMKTVRSAAWWIRKRSR